MLKLGDKVRPSSAYTHHANKQHLADAVGHIRSISYDGGVKYEVEWEGIWFGGEDDWCQNELVLVEDESFKPNQVVNVLDDSFNRDLGYTGTFGEALPQGVVVRHIPENIHPERWQVEFTTPVGRQEYIALTSQLQAVPDDEVLPNKWGLNKPIVECSQHNHKLWTADENGCGEFRRKPGEMVMINNSSKSVWKDRLESLICFGLMMLSLVALLVVSFGLTYLITASAASFVLMSSQFDLTQWDTTARVAFLPLWVVVVVSAITFSLQEG